MITKKEAREIALNYLKQRNREFIDIEEYDKILLGSKEVLHGKRKGEFLEQYTVTYYMPWGLEEKMVFIHIDAHTGEVLYTITPTSYLEEWEEFNGM